jgi:hypothetical protein
MDTANLSYAQVAITLIGSLMFAGIGLVIGRRVFPHFRTHRKEVVKIEPLIRDSGSPGIPSENGRLLPIEILGLEGNIIRYRDGSFGKAFTFEPANTLYDDGRLTEQRISRGTAAALSFFLTPLLFACLAATAAGQRPRPPRPPRVEGQTPIGTMNGRPVTANDLILGVNTDSPFMPPLDGSPAPVLQQFENQYPANPAATPVPGLCFLRNQLHRVSASR